MFEGSDGRYDYVVTLGTGENFVQFGSRYNSDGHELTMIMGIFDKIEDGQSIYTNGAYCWSIKAARSAYVVIETDSSLSELETIFPEPDTCVYKAVIRVPVNYFSRIASDAFALILDGLL